MYEFKLGYTKYMESFGPKKQKKERKKERKKKEKKTKGIFH